MAKRILTLLIIFQFVETLGIIFSWPEVAIDVTQCFIMLLGVLAISKNILE